MRLFRRSSPVWFVVRLQRLVLLRTGGAVGFDDLLTQPGRDRPRVCWNSGELVLLYAPHGPAHAVLAWDVRHGHRVVFDRGSKRLDSP